MKVFAALFVALCLLAGDALGQITFGDNRNSGGSSSSSSFTFNGATSASRREGTSARININSSSQSRRGKACSRGVDLGMQNLLYTLGCREEV